MSEKTTDDLNDLRVKAESGDPRAQFELGAHLRRLQEHPEASDWLRKAAENGHAEAMFAMAFEVGFWGIEQSEQSEQSIGWLRRAAELGHADAQAWLGNYLAEKKEFPEAMRWLCKAALQGHSHILDHEIPNLLEHIRESSRTFAKYQQGADSGDTESQYQLGHIYYQGLGVDVDHDTAVELWRIAANSGHAGAKRILERLDAGY